MACHTHWITPKIKVGKHCVNYEIPSISTLTNANTNSSAILPDKLDEEVVQDGVRIFIDRKAQLSLLGTEMDFVESKLSAEFVFNNPNIKGTCGCGESFSL